MIRIAQKASFFTKLIVFFFLLQKELEGVDDFRRLYGDPKLKFSSSFLLFGKNTFFYLFNIRIRSDHTDKKTDLF